jgi:hypothetical protein
MATNVERYPGAAKDLGDAPSVRAFLQRDFREEPIAEWVRQMAIALGVGGVAPHDAEPPVIAPASTKATLRQANLERRRSNVVRAARNLMTEMKRLNDDLVPLTEHMPPRVAPDYRPGEDEHSRALRTTRATYQWISDRSLAARVLGVPLGVAMVDFSALATGLEQTAALVETLTRWAAWGRPSKKPRKRGKGARAAAQSRDEALAAFLAVNAHARLKPKQLAALECLARGEFAVTKRSRSAGAWASTKIREWEKTLDRTKPVVEDFLLLFEAADSPEMGGDAVGTPTGE